MSGTPKDTLKLSNEAHQQLWETLGNQIRSFQDRLPEQPVVPSLEKRNQKCIVDALAKFDFKQAMPASDLLNFAVKGLCESQLQTSHPRYYGVFNPAPTTMGVLGEALTAAFNPQLASWTSSPFAIELEQHLIRAFGEQFGYTADSTEGTFTAGGTEANQTALLCALHRRFPQYRSQGARALPPLCVYVCREAHHSFVRAVQLAGLGTESIVEIPSTDDLTIDTGALDAQIRKDREKGKTPFFVVGTAGTTNAGMIDPLFSLKHIAQQHELWFHVDAAWGGAAVIVDECRSWFEGIESADSITLDTHKWYSIPMTAGLYLSRHLRLLETTFRTDKTDYMPDESRKQGKAQPYAQSMAWSRRFYGLKVFLSLGAAGWGGYAEVFRHQIKMGQRLRQGLAKAGWTLCNRSPLPVVCFTQPEWSSSDVETFAAKIAEEGRTWITTTRVGNQGLACLRAGIANYLTQASDVDALIALLEGSLSRLKTENAL